MRLIVASRDCPEDKRSHNTRVEYIYSAQRRCLNHWHAPKASTPGGGSRSSFEMLRLRRSFIDIHEEQMPKSPVLIFGQDVSCLPKGCIFMIGSLGIFILYIVYGGVQEYLFKTPGLSEHFMALTAYQFCLYGIISFIESRIIGVVYHSNFPPWLYCSVGITTTGTILLSNAAVVYLNYPTQVIFKCCKLIPVMVFSVVIQGKQYKFIDYVAVACMIVGLIFFTLTDVSVQLTFDIRGIFAISLALICDGYIGNLQELAMKSYHIPALQILTYSYAFGFVLILVLLLLTNNLISSAVFFFEHFSDVFFWSTLFVLSGYFGLQFVLLLVHHFGALLAVTVTTVRKAVTIVLSFLVFRKPFSIEYVWSGSLVVIGIFLHSYSKNNGPKAERDYESKDGEQQIV
ncbi:Adenosine 3'-phospho 5'-phosphosulfate transporter 2 [Echinococcus granulosus]|uniref:Adenosine 3'-phospho 5'-phosphosulfate transporter 2 n=2 Tax=Echinococcus granulosus TaxID=6210 RepID=A0A068WIB5_ECHGR|nr:Adenosine 3'-phospho 5'-phosphosulfate transporter 2 [Echinococcus granulosus]CDS19510.1 adenosine 3' phospho 5' phosphosulfate [Echinococcus granulosus]